MGQRYYHFILIAKDAIGAKGIREMSSTAWLNSYFDRGLERVPLLKSELLNIMDRYKGHIIGTTACIGGELGTSILNLDRCEKLEDTVNAERYSKQIYDFLIFCKTVFDNDFYLEVAPGESEDQIIVNKRIKKIAESFKIDICIGSDAHYLKKEDRYVHKAYLNSKGGEREVDAFYEFTYVQSDDEVREHLRASLSDDDIDRIFENSNKMKDSIEFYSLERNQSVPEVEVTDYPKSSWWGVNNPDADEMSNYPELQRLFLSDNIQERYWINECWQALNDKIGPWVDHLDYVARLNEEARVKRVIGEKLNTCMFAYPNTLKHYIDLFWECGSTVGAGRGSACAALNHYLLGITQLDPIKWDLPFWRYLNDERTELGDVDIDLAPSKIQKIFQEIRKERGELGLVQVCTFGTEGTKSAILTACRGYRSEEYPTGIDVDEAQYLSSLVPSERGFLWPIDDVVRGNAEKGRKPVQSFISTVNQYPGLLDIITHIQGIVNKRSSHASGVILFDEDIYETAAVMRTPKGSLITQWDLHDQEAAGGVKYDFLLTSVQDIIIQTIELLQEDGQIEKDLSLREVYNKYLHPAVLPQDDDRMWNALANGDVLGCFQFDSAVGGQAAKKIRPKNPREMSDANGLMRLMTAGRGQESPLDKYVRFKNNISLWYKEMDEQGLTKQEQKILEPYFLPSYGVPPSQES
jgi:DNA polymerase-3 subunit alpha